MKSEKSIYKTFVGSYVQVEYHNGDAALGKLVQANKRFLKLQPSFHLPLKKDSIDQRVSSIDLEELKKRFDRNAPMILNASGVCGVSDITSVFRDDLKLI